MAREHRARRQLKSEKAHVMIVTRKMTPLAGAAVAALLGGATAHADTVVTGNSGYWATYQTTSGNYNACVLVTTTVGNEVSISANNIEPALRLVAEKKSWHIPPEIKTALSIQVDSNPAWTGDAAVPQSYRTDMLAMAVHAATVREFVQQITAGSVLHVYFSSNEPPWTFSLSGVSTLWPEFMSCVEMWVPAVASSLAPTQPFVATAPAAPTPQPFSTPDTLAPVPMQKRPPFTER
jgi:hypothetical protein